MGGLRWVSVVCVGKRGHPGAYHGTDKKRIVSHRNPLPFSKAFTTRYKCYYLLYYEHFFDIEDAIKREKQIKGWSRVKKERLITKFNPDWRFMNDEI